MTRKEARKKIKNCWSYLHDGKAYINEERIHNVIDQIYDDFEEAMKPKTCNECEWWDFNSYGIFKKCFNGEGNCVSTNSSFGCNRFKQKDNA